MIEIIASEKFKRRFKSWKKKRPDLIEAFRKKLELFSNEPFHPSLKTHHLTGEMKDALAFSINFEYRVVFKFREKKSVQLINIGTHDEVY